LDTTLPGNFLQDTLNVGVYVAVGKTNDAQATLLQPFGSSLIVELLVRRGVTIAVNLNHQLVLIAEEIENEAIDGMLATKFDGMKLLAAQSLPQFGFVRRHRAAQFFSASQDGRIDIPAGTIIDHGSSLFEEG
jgi:hypothetical protein